MGDPKDANAESTPNIEPVKTLSPEEEEQEILRLEKEQEEWNRRNDELRLALERQTKLAKLRQARQQQMAEHQKLLEQSQQAQAQQALAAQQMAQDAARQAAAHQAALAAMGNSTLSAPPLASTASSKAALRDGPLMIWGGPRAENSR